MSSLPRPLSQSRPTATPPHTPTSSSTTCPCRQQHVTSCRHHRGDMAHQRRRLIPGPIVCHPHRTLPRAATAAPMCHHYQCATAAIYISLLPHSRCPHLPPFATMHLTPVPPHVLGPPPCTHVPLCSDSPPPPTHFPHAWTPHISCTWFAHCVRCLADCAHSIDQDCEWLDFCGDS